jgi:hypothetical protein
MRTIDPSIMLAAMATLHTPPRPAAQPRGNSAGRRTRSVTYAPLTPPAISVSRAA